MEVVSILILFMNNTCHLVVYKKFVHDFLAIQVKTWMKNFRMNIKMDYIMQAKETFTPINLYLINRVKN